MRRPFRQLVLLALLACPAGAQQPPETFSEKLIIREREILVDLPDILADDRLPPTAFQVLVDGQPREVTRAEPSQEAPWTFVLYVDQVLARPGTVFYSSLAFAARAQDLARLGNVEVVVAGSDPRTVLGPTRDVKLLTQTLTDLSAAARVERDRSEAFGGTDPSPLQIRRQLEKLTAFLTARRPPGPHALFLLADGLELPPTATARLLAAYGWVTIPVPLRKEGLGLQASTQSDIETFRQSTSWGTDHPGVPPVIGFIPPRGSALSFPGVIDVLIAPQTAALRALAQATAGTVIGYEVQLDAMLRALPRRWRLWIEEPDKTVDGRLRPLSVALRERGALVRGPAWIRSSTPREVAEARLENLLAVSPTGGDLPVKVSFAGTELSIEAEPIQVPDSAPPGPVRVSWAFSGPDGAAGVRHEILEIGDQIERGWRRTLRIEVPPGVRVAVVVEAMGPERWAGRVVETGER